VGRCQVRFLTSLALSAAFAAPLAAQAGTLRGTIADSGGAPLSNATVAVDGTEARGVSGGAGQYEIRGVPAGEHPLAPFLEERGFLLTAHGYQMRRIHHDDDSAAEEESSR